MNIQTTKTLKSKHTAIKTKNTLRKHPFRLDFKNEKFAKHFDKIATDRRLSKQRLVGYLA